MTATAAFAQHAGCHNSVCFLALRWGLLDGGGNTAFSPKLMT